MIEKVLVGIDGSERGARAQAWAVNFANHESAAVTLMLVIGARFTRNSGMPSEQIRAVAFALEMARETKEPLELVSTWGLPVFLSKPAKAMGGELTDIGRQYQKRIDALVAQLKEANPDIEISGQAVEGESPTGALIDYTKSSGVLVLGTRTTSALGRALFGSLTHSVLMNLTIPTIVVSQP